MAAASKSGLERSLFNAVVEGFSLLEDAHTYTHPEALRLIKNAEAVCTCNSFNWGETIRTKVYVLLLLESISRWVAWPLKKGRVVCAIHIFEILIF